MSLLINDATILTPNGSVRGSIYIEENKIVSISKGSDGKPSEVEFKINAQGKIAIPGLVNSHTHVSMTSMRGLGEDLPLHQWLEQKIWPLEAKQNPSDVSSAAMLAFCEMIRSGTTCFADMCLFDPKPLFEAAKKIGIRGLVARGAMDFDDPKKAKNLLKEIEQSTKYGDDLVKAGISAHAPYTCSEEFLIKTKELAKKKNLKYQIHVAETRKEVFDTLKKTGKYPYEYLDSIGLMDKDSIFAHGGWLTKREMSLAGKRGISVASCPVSNLKLATGGICQITELHKCGANVCLGTDSTGSNNSLNMFETTKMASLLQKHHYWKADVLPVKDVFNFATSGGASATGFDCGIIKEGKLADIVLLERLPNMWPENDLLSNLVFCANPSNVSDVVIDGKVVMQDRKIMTVDESEVMSRAGKSISRLI